MIVEDYLHGYNVVERGKVDPQTRGGLPLFDRQVSLVQLLDILARQDVAAFGDQMGLTVYGLDDLLFLEDEAQRGALLQQVRRPLQHAYDFLANNGLRLLFVVDGRIERGRNQRFFLCHPRRRGDRVDLNDLFSSYLKLQEDRDGGPGWYYTERIT